MRAATSTALFWLLRGGVAFAEGNAPSVASEDWRAVAPAAQVATELPSAGFAVTKLANGLTVFVLDDASAREPIVHLELVTLGGAATDPPDRWGQTMLTYAVSYFGGGRHLGHDFNQYLARLGAAFDVQVHEDYGSILMMGPSRNLGRMVDLMGQVVREPFFEPKSFGQLRKYLRSRIYQPSADPMSLAQALMAPLAYGDRHPYAHPVVGTQQTLARVDAERAFEHRVRLLRPERSALIVAGAVRSGAVAELVEHAFGEWKLPKIDGLRTVPPSHMVADDRIVLMDRPGMSQTLVCAVRDVMGRASVDGPALQVASRILAGQFESRLVTTMRETEGYTYGAFADVEWHDHVSLLSICGKFERSATVQALQDLLHELDRMASSPPDDDAVARALRGMEGARAARSETLHGRVSEAIEMFLNEGALNGKEALRPEVTARAVTEVARRYLESSGMRLLVVGDAQELAPALAQFGRPIVRAASPNAK